MMVEDAKVRLDMIASRVLERLEELISAMERAADQVADGDDPEKVDVGEHQLYMLPDKEGKDPIIVCFWTADDYFKLLESSASEADICLEDMVELFVQVPETEFEDGLMTGGFKAWKGISVELKSDPMEDLISKIGERLKARGMGMNLDSDEDVVFYLPVGKRTSKIA